MLKGWRLYLSLFLFPLNLCGLMLLIALRARPMADQFRWPLLLAALILSAPSVLFLVLNLPKHQEEDEDDEDEDEENNS